jgi:haloalkane dehalogenase
VWGDRDPILGRALRGVAESLPEASVVRVPAGHFLQEEAPVPIADAIREVARRAKLP